MRSQLCQLFGLRDRSAASIRVMMTVWLSLGRVYSAQSAAAAPQKLDTPGVSS